MSIEDQVLSVVSSRRYIRDNTRVTALQSCRDMLVERWAVDGLIKSCVRRERCINVDTFLGRIPAVFRMTNSQIRVYQVSSNDIQLE